MEVDDVKGWSVCQYGARDEAPHPADGEENYNESVYFNFYDPEASLGAVLRIGNHPTNGYAEMTVNMPTPAGPLAFRYLRENTDSNSEFSAGGMNVRIAEPTRLIDLTYKGTVALVDDARAVGINAKEAFARGREVECTLDLHWTSTHPLHVWDPHGGGDVSKDGSIAYARNHYEQFGTFDGDITVDGARWTISEAPAFRDHSWGRREWESGVSNFSVIYLANGRRIVAAAIRADDGSWPAQGVVWEGDQFQYVAGYHVDIDYSGGVDCPLDLPIRVVSPPLEEAVLRGSVLAYLPLRSYNRKTDRGIRICQVLSRFESSLGPGWGWHDLSRPMPTNERDLKGQS